MKQKGIQKVVSIVMKERDNKNDNRHSTNGGYYLSLANSTLSPA